MPRPNQITNSGAIAIFGMLLNAARNGRITLFMLSTYTTSSASSTPTTSAIARPARVVVAVKLRWCSCSVNVSANRLPMTEGTGST